MARTRRAPKSPLPPISDPAPIQTGGAADPAAGRPAWRSARDFAVTLGAALLIALAVKAYVADVYVIPSGSMETVLHGRPDGGDRIFCSKLSYRFRPPRRWEVVVFEFPYEAALLAGGVRPGGGIGESEAAREHRGQIEQYRNQNFVKRLVGMPGETLAIARGDIWVRPDGPRAEFARLVKPARAQRGMWQNVCEEDFTDCDLDELAGSWRISGEGVSLGRGGPLRLSPNSGGAGLDYRPRTPSRVRPGFLEELPGIPDRYVLEQPVRYACRNLTAAGAPCGRLFVKTQKTQSMPARCPECGFLNDETAAVFYHRRSGLYLAAGRGWPPQGEDAPPRQDDYHLVPDLRLLADISLADAKTVLCLTLREDSRQAQARFRGDGGVEIRLNGHPSRPEARAVANLEPGREHRVEFQVADGVARIYVDSAEDCLLELPIWDDRRPAPDSLPRSSGAGISAEGGEARIRRLILDRDVFYYSGLERPGRTRLPGLNSLGEAFIDADSFLPLGDHCPSSFDARSWGPVSLSRLRGPALFVWWPPERIGRIAAP